MTRASHRRDARPATLGTVNWRKGTRSIGNGDCVEAGPVLRFSPAGWTVFLAAVKRRQGS